jgi:superfamily I DNA/RNA helicase
VTESIVAVKGLRFDHVFVAGVAHERFPRIYTSRAMAFSRTYGLIVRENIAGGAAQTAKFAWYYAKFGAKAMYIDEERRALSYGLSRARIGATATGYGTPPYWAREHDLLAGLEGKEE